MAGTVGVAPGTTTITLSDGQTFEIADWIDDKFYATGQTVNGSTNGINIFAGALSQPIPGGRRSATAVDTNLKRNGDVGLSQSWAMLIYSIGARIVRVMRAPTTSTDAPVLPDGVSGSLSNVPTLQTLLNIDRMAYLRFVYNSKEYSQGVMSDYSQGNGYSVFSTNSVFEYAQNGIASPRDRNALVLPIELRENLGFGMEFNPAGPLVIDQEASDGGTALTFADVKIEFYGLIKKNVV